MEGLFDASLLCGHRLFHDKVIEIPAWVYSSLLVKTTLLHIIVHFIDQLFAHMQHLGPAHSVIAIAKVSRLVR